MLELASKVHHHGSNVQPMVVEAPRGTILAAVGEPRDNAVAGDVLRRVQEERATAAAAARRTMHREGETRGDEGSPGEVGGGTKKRPPAAAPYAGRMDQVVFGAVYEHTWNGRPVYVGDTDAMPERTMALDRKRNGEVRRTMAMAGHDGGARVVWAGVGRGPVGRDEMRAIRTAIVEDRSARLRVQKLRGPKPYSRHG